MKQRGAWTAWISNSGRERAAYGPDEIDYFFVIDGDFGYYLIPVAAVGGLTAIRLAAYSEYRLLAAAPVDDLPDCVNAASAPSSRAPAR